MRMVAIGFIGLGVMGMPMAAHLVTAGHVVTAYVRSPERAAVARSRGIRIADSVATAADGAEIAITMLPDAPDVTDVAFEAGMLDALRPGAVWLDMSTIDPAAARGFHHAATARGIEFLDAPVSGGEAGAVSASLSIMVGGDPDVLERVRPVLEVMGTTVVHVGASGAGQVVKAANQIIVAGNIQVLAEALLFLRAHDAEIEPALEVLGGGLAGSTVLRRKGASMAEGRFEPGFRSVLHLKDLRIVAGAARDQGIALPVTALVGQFMQALVSRGDGGLDHSALYALALDLQGGVR